MGCVFIFFLLLFYGTVPVLFIFKCLLRLRYPVRSCLVCRNREDSKEEHIGCTKYLIQYIIKGFLPVLYGTRRAYCVSCIINYIPRILYGMIYYLTYYSILLVERCHASCSRGSRQRHAARVLYPRPHDSKVGGLDLSFRWLRQQHD